MTQSQLLTPAALTTELDALLADLEREYTALAELVAAHRDAIRRADGPAIQACADRQQSVLTSIGEVDQRRRELVAAACARFPHIAARRATAITLTDLARCASESDRPRLIERASALRTVIAQTQAQTAGVRGATEALLAHMEGLMRQVGRQLSHAGTYSRRGYIEPGGVVVSALDIRS